MSNAEDPVTYDHSECPLMKMNDVFGLQRTIRDVTGRETTKVNRAVVTGMNDSNIELTAYDATGAELGKMAIDRNDIKNATIVIPNRYGKPPTVLHPVSAVTQGGGARRRHSVRRRVSRRRLRTHK